MSAIGALDAKKSEELRSRYGGGGGYNWDFLGAGGGGYKPQGPAAAGDSVAPGMCDPLGASSVNFDSWGMDGMMAEGETKKKPRARGRSRTGRTTRSRRSRRSRRGSQARRGARARRGRRTRRSRRAA